MRFLKFKKDSFQARILPLFLELGWLPINQICIERRLLLLKKILDGCAPDYLSEKLLSLKYHKSHDTRSRLPYRLPVPRTNSMKRLFLYNAVKLWKLWNSLFLRCSLSLTICSVVQKSRNSLRTRSFGKVFFLQMAVVKIWRLVQSND